MLTLLQTSKNFQHKVISSVYSIDLDEIASCIILGK